MNIKDESIVKGFELTGERIDNLTALVKTLLIRIELLEQIQGGKE